MNFRFTNADTALKGTVILPVAENNSFMPIGKALNTALKGALQKAVKAQTRFTGQNGQVLVVNGFTHNNVDQVILLGVGDVKALQDADFQRLGAIITAQLNQMGVARAQVVVHDIENKSKNTKIAATMAFGAKLKSYRFDNYKTKMTKEQKPSLVQLDFVVSSRAEAQKDWKAFSGLTEGIYLARDLVTEPPNKIYAEKFVERVRQSLKGLPIRVKALNKAQMEKLGMGALLSVNNASGREPYTLVFEYKGLKNKKSFDLALVGKGVTFDTGGISIKPGMNMWDMKNDMAGAAAVTGAMRALAHRGAKANVVGIVGLVENVISENATLPSDVVTSMSGQTIEVLNTDAEGRLVLADIMWYVQQTYKPQIMLDAATLTGAVIMALSDKYAGVFGEDDVLVNDVLRAGKETGDAVWHLPMGAALDRQLDSHIADVANISVTGGAGASTGAVFLKRFVQEKTRWAHIDMAGMAWSKSPSVMNPAGASGFGVRLFDQFVRNVLEKETVKPKKTAAKKTAKTSAKTKR